MVIRGGPQKAPLKALSIVKIEPFSVYPNLTFGRFTPTHAKIQDHEALVEVCNLQGTQVFSKTLQNTPSAQLI